MQVQGGVPASFPRQAVQVLPLASLRPRRNRLGRCHLRQRHRPAIAKTRVGLHEHNTGTKMSFHKIFDLTSSSVFLFSK